MGSRVIPVPTVPTVIPGKVEDPITGGTPTPSSWVETVANTRVRAVMMRQEGQEEPQDGATIHGSTMKSPLPMEALLQGEPAGAQLATRKRMADTVPTVPTEPRGRMARAEKTLEPSKTTAHGLRRTVATEGTVATELAAEEAAAEEAALKAVLVANTPTEEAVPEVDPADAQATQVWPVMAAEAASRFTWPAGKSN